MDFVKLAVKMFGCDTARISKPLERMFLILVWKRNTRGDEHQWYKNGEPYDFDYVHETVIASGDTDEELLTSMKKYKQLQGPVVKGA